MGALSIDSVGALRERRRVVAMAALALLVLALHGWGLRVMHALTLKDKPADTLDLSITVRSIELPPPADAQPPMPDAPPQPAPAPEPPASPAPKPAPAAAPAARQPIEPPSPPASAPEAPPETVALANEPAASAPPLPASSAAPEIMSDAPAASDTGGTIVGMPVYDALLPPSATWRYRLQRGLLSGEAQLEWLRQPDGSYSLGLDGTVAGINALKWRSIGAVGPFGAAPARFTVQRRGRGEQAANFDNGSRVITFSGSTQRLPWVNGVQDRLSWMVQLPAIVQAEPGRFKAGETVLLMVVSASGGAELWTFVVEGEESVDGVAALKLLRQPGKPYGTKAQVWLDPARGHMPLRAILTQGDDGSPLQLDLLP
jgi:hypothetical protein